MDFSLNYTLESPHLLTQTETNIGTVELEYYISPFQKGMNYMFTKFNSTQLLFMPDLKISFPQESIEFFTNFITCVINEIHAKVMKKGSQDFEFDFIADVLHHEKGNWKVYLKMGKYADWKEISGKKWVEPVIENHEILIGEEGFDLMLRSNKRFNDWRLDCIHERFDWKGIRLEGRNLSKAILINFDFAYAEFYNCNFKNCIFTGSNIKNVTFYNCNLEDTIWGKQQRVQSKVNSIIMPYLKNGNHVQDSSFLQCNLQNSVLDGSTFENCAFDQVNMSGIQNEELQLLNCHFNQ